MTEKKCSKCGEVKSISEFHKKRNVCIKCRNNNSKQWYYKNKEHKLQYQKQWNYENKEHVKVYQNKYQNKYHKDNKGYSKKYYQNNKEYIIKSKLQYKKEHPDKYREYSRKRRALKVNAEGSFTEKEFNKQLIFYHYKCLSCGADLKEVIINRDHIQPLSKGGSNYIENIQPLCVHCNCSKGVKYIDYRDNWLQHYGI